jgi:hypothetical protein
VVLTEPAEVQGVGAAMLTKAEALELLLREIPADCDVMEEATIERPYGWLFFFQGKRFIETRDPRDGLAGSGGILVESDGGRCVKFGSRYRTDINLKIYEAGYLDHNDFDLIISAILNLDEAMELLRDLRIRFATPEVAYGVTWRIPKQYSASQLHQRLLKLPCRFNLGSLYFRYEVLELMKNSACLKFELVPNTGFRNEG